MKDLNGDRVEGARIVRLNLDRGISLEIISQVILKRRVNRANYIIGRYAKTGDPLAIKIYDFLNSINDEREMIKATKAIRESPIPYELMTRSMSERDYYAYLRGERPIGRFRKKKYYLKDD